MTLTARTVTDLITQATPTQYSHQASVMSAASISNYLQVASSVLAPYSASNMTMVVSQVVVNSGGTTGTVTWSEPYNGATARPANQVINLPGTIGTGQVGNYFVLGEVYYNYIPLNFYMSLSAIPLYGSIFLTPRQSTSIICSDCVHSLEWPQQLTGRRETEPSSSVQLFASRAIRPPFGRAAARCALRSHGIVIARSAATKQSILLHCDRWIASRSLAMMVWTAPP